MPGCSENEDSDAALENNGGDDATKDGRYLTYCKPGGTYLSHGRSLS